MNRRFILALAILFFLLIFFCTWNVASGSVRISVPEIFEILFRKNSTTPHYSVLWKIRLPRLCAAVVLGGALCTSGFLLQTFFSNPIAGPYVLGISSGAKFTVALTMIFFLNMGIRISSLAMVTSAFAGSLLAMGIVLLLSFRVKNMSVLVVCGILTGYICSALTDFLVTFANDSSIVNLHNWSLGSFSGTSWNDVKIMCCVVFPVMVFSFLISKPMGAFLLGENYARNMGVNVKALRIALIIFSSLLSACVTAFAGPVSFVGIAVPHLIRALSGTSRPIFLVPACFLGGAAVTVFFDGLARTVFAPQEMSISTVTAIFLVPVVIWMMIKKRKQ